MLQTAITQRHLLQVFEILFGDNIVLKQVPEHISPSKAMTVGRYAREDGTAGGWFIADVMFATAAGGALTMVPPDVVREAAKTGTLSGSLLENLNEVLNICASLFQSESTAHLAFERLGAPASFADLPKDGTGKSSSFEIQFPRYGKARFSLMTD